MLQWGAQALNNMLIVPPGSGIVHQVNLEYLARVVFADKDTTLLYPDTVVSVLLGKVKNVVSFGCKSIFKYWMFKKKTMVAMIFYRLGQTRIQR